MGISPDSFKGKVWLLVIDKMIIGAILAFAFFVYDNWKTNADRRYTNAVRAVEREFERAKLSASLVPAYADARTDPITKAYLLRAAILSGTIEASAGWELGLKLMPLDLDVTHIVRAIAPTMPSAIADLSRTAAKAFRQFSEHGLENVRFHDYFQRNLNEELTLQDAKQAEILKALLDQAALKIGTDCEPIHTDAEIANHLFGLAVLIDPNDPNQARMLLGHPCAAFRILGGISAIYRNSHGYTASAGSSDYHYLLSIMMPPKNASPDRIDLSSEVLITLTALNYHYHPAVLQSLARVISFRPYAGSNGHDSALDTNGQQVEPNVGEKALTNFQQHAQAILREVVSKKGFYNQSGKFAVRSAMLRLANDVLLDTFKNSK